LTTLDKGAMFPLPSGDSLIFSWFLEGLDEDVDTVDIDDIIIAKTKEFEDLRLNGFKSITQRLREQNFFEF